MLYDLIVLGSGPAGYLAGERAGHAGMRVLCIEGRDIGGVCLNEGCIPTKTLLYSAKIYDNAMHGEKYGVAATAAIEHGKVLARKNKVVRTLVAGVKSALKANGVTVVNGLGVIKGKTDAGFAVEAAGVTHYGRRLLIATGSTPVVPPIPGVKEGLESGFVLTSREALTLADPPGRLVVVGGGVIGLELAAYFHTIGTQVAVVEMLDHIAGETDAELAAILQKGYEKKGMAFYLGARVTAITANSVRFDKCGETTELTADAVLLSVGRRPHIADIGLESLGVVAERGAILTDKHMQTNIPGVYAAGDVNGVYMLAHAAYREAEVAVNHMIGVRDTMCYDAIPAVIYTNPELACVGETEEAARERGRDVDVVKIPLRFSGRYVAENEGGDGICKLVVDKRTKIIRGAHALCNYSSEFIVAAGMFITLGLKVEDVKKIVFPHPTVAEILREAVFQF
ncbi:MAG: dihydrolipoyl dehydrogenase [Clostridiales bacterium]|jgi:dihydrolipoamide dehydrogenase|nr:dihydrolipoyl dehydrogenase [Clostridiales bacterium]